MGTDADSSEEEENKHNQILICDAKLKEFERFKEKYEKSISCRMLLQGDRIFIYESPKRVHGVCQVEIVRQLSNEATQHHNDELVICGPEDLLIDNSSKREPDISLVPLNRLRHVHNSSNHRGSPYPTLVVEIGVSRNLTYLFGFSICNLFQPKDKNQIILSYQNWETPAKWDCLDDCFIV
eukprot:TRINITY_DN22251_c0_g1_i1.p1 TRINITY_DN22251_c0_g1~~TRINITY_DN22251_c0_g1_i1.p1  ORF type:complete len:202 (+),score=11.10 TRINITY_DN22251_c0_g1_i1:64-606(+)